MNQSSIVIIGANGQLGQALQAQYPEAVAVDAAELDITDINAVEAFDWTGVRTVLNAAAFTNVDGAETAEGRPLAWRVNAAGPANLAKIASAHDITLVHISTDYVFDGSEPLHSEHEQFAPLSVYGASKAAGDIVVSLTPKHYLLRTSWVIGNGKNFVRTMLGLAEKGISPTVVADQVGRLTFTSELVRAIDFLFASNAPFGTYNVSNDGQPVSWAEITRRIFAHAGHTELTVTDTTTVEYFAGKEGIAPRPLQSTLDLAKLHRAGFVSIHWEDDLRNYIEKELAS